MENETKEENVSSKGHSGSDSQAGGLVKIFFQIKLNLVSRGPGCLLLEQREVLCIIAVKTIEIWEGFFG